MHTYIYTYEYVYVQIIYNVYVYDVCILFKIC